MLFTVRRASRIGERLSEHLRKLREQLRLGLEEFVIVALGHDQCGLIRLLHDRNTVVRWE